MEQMVIVGDRPAARVNKGLACSVTTDFGFPFIVWSRARFRPCSCPSVAKQTVVVLPALPPGSVQQYVRFCASSITRGTLCAFDDLVWPRAFKYVTSVASFCKLASVVFIKGFKGPC